MINDDLVERYDRTTVLFHWLTVGLILILWGLGQGIDFFPRGAPRVAVRSVHIVLGAMLGVVLLSRIVYRVGWGRRMRTANSGLMGHIATATHWGLYILIAATVILGVANAWIRGDTIFGLFRIPSLAPGDTVLRGVVEFLHSTAANVILIVAGLHAVAALFHHFLLRDAVLRRMLPTRRSAR